MVVFDDTLFPAFIYGCIGGFAKAWGDYKSVKESDDESKRKVLKNKVYYCSGFIVKVFISGVICRSIRKSADLHPILLIATGYIGENLLPVLAKSIPRLVSGKEEE